MAIKVDLVIIDPQTDFCDSQKGSLYVKGAEDDMQRVTELIKRIGGKLNDIHVTLDTHHFVDIAHPIFWKDTAGNHPDPFTIIMVEDISNGKWVTTIPSLYRRAEQYVKELAKNNRYPLCIWPPHCLIGSNGHAIVNLLFDVLIEWEKTGAMVDYVTKGSNPFTEHYSAVKADVPDSSDPTTQINTKFIQTLLDAEIIAVCGEAGSHCLANTVRDIANEFGDDGHIKKMVLLEDGTSPVPTFESLQEEFIKEMIARGMQISNTVDFLK